MNGGLMTTDRYITGDTFKIKLIKEKDAGKVLDIGGGGEGFIGNIYGSNAVAIDIREDELLETKNDALKIVMDAKNMTFVDESFDTVTLFYSLMYMKESTKEAVLKEAYRVLKYNGNLYIWDNELPSYQGGEKDVYVSQLQVDYDDHVTSTGYGIGLSDGQSFDKITMDLKTCGFDILDSDNQKEHFKIVCKKRRDQRRKKF